MNRTRLIVSLLAIFASCVSSQSVTVAGAGFISPVPIPIAPGGIVTIYLTSIGDGLQQPVGATSLPLPYTLAGISVTMNAGTSAAMNDVNGNTPVPLLAVFPVSTCLGAPTVGCSQFTGITLQIPYELLPNGFSLLGAPPNNGRLTVSQAGKTATVEIWPLFDNVHILRSGDSITSPGVSGGVNPMLLVPAVTHADGTAVSARSPALPGETLVLYAVGLGRTTPLATTGDKSTVAAPSGPMTIGFVYQAGVGTSTPPAAAPVFAGLTPGFAGLYQVNFVVPAAPSSLQGCTRDVFSSNLTITLAGRTSLDVAGICVQPPPAPAQ